MAAPQETSPAPFRVSTLELFFDLVFVFTITQLTETIADHPTAATFGNVVLILAVVWWMYSGYAWLTNAVAPNSTTRRTLLLTGMAGFLVMALAIPEAFGDYGWLFGVSYLVVNVVHSALFRLAGPESRQAMRVLTPMNILAALLVLAGGFLPEPYRHLAWIAAPLIQIMTGYLNRIEMHSIFAPHFVERHSRVTAMSAEPARDASGPRSVDDQAVFDLVIPLPPYEQPLLDAVGLPLCEDVRSPIALPRFTNSSMDGYVVRVEDVVEALGGPAGAPAGRGGVRGGQLGWTGCCRRRRCGDHDRCPAARGRRRRSRCILFEPTAAPPRSGSGRHPARPARAPGGRGRRAGRPAARGGGRSRAAGGGAAGRGRARPGARQAAAAGGGDVHRHRAARAGCRPRLRLDLRLQQRPARRRGPRRRRDPLPGGAVGDDPHDFSTPCPTSWCGPTSWSPAAG